MSFPSFIHTSESVSDGHPDKMADQISDAILDAFLQQDKYSRVAIETLVKDSLVVIAGEVTSKAHVQVQDIVKQVISSIGYNSPETGLIADLCTVLTSVGKQSPHISQGVNDNPEQAKTTGAGDQGMMFGYACKDSKNLMPLAIELSHALMFQHKKIRAEHHWILPDAKAQVTLRYKNNVPDTIDNIVLSSQHTKQLDGKTIEDYDPRVREAIIELIIKPVLENYNLNLPETMHINPTGKFEIGGPVGDCGLTGRKIIVDTYGGMARHGGGAFSGKDPTKVDRSAAYACRYIAKNVVAADLAQKCEVAVSYAIGRAEPTSIKVETFGTGDAAAIEQKISSVFDLTPNGIIDTLDLRNCTYRPTATFGHFGRDEFSWEKLDKVEILRHGS